MTDFSKVRRFLRRGRNLFISVKTEQRKNAKKDREINIKT